MGVDKLEEKGCEHPFLGGRPGKIDIEIYLAGLFASVPFSETLSKRIEEDGQAVVEIITWCLAIATLPFTFSFILMKAHK